MTEPIHDATYRCRQGTLQKGDVFRVQGGPYYVMQDGTRRMMGEKGNLRFVEFVEAGDQQYIVAMSSSGRCVLQLGPEFKSHLVPGMIMRPYRITKIITRRTSTESGDDEMATRTKKRPTKKRTTKRTAKKATRTKKRPTKKRARTRNTTNGKVSATDAAAKVLGQRKGPMTSKELIDAMATNGYWKSPGGATPHATLYTAIIREISKKGKAARFRKAERGKFALNK